MFNQNLLKAKMVEKGISSITLCNGLGICEATLYRKLSRKGDFSRFEIGKIADILELTSEERDNIFLLFNFRKRKKLEWYIKRGGRLTKEHLTVAGIEAEKKGKEKTNV